MRMLMTWMLIVVLTILAGPLAASTLAAPDSTLVALAGDLHRVADDDRDDEEDRDRGHGNDPGSVDEDNPGRGRGNPANTGEAPGQPVFRVTSDYTVETECEFDADDEITECAFEAATPDDASDVGRLTVPADAVCTEVIGGDFVIVESESGTRVSGYASEEGEDELELEFHGEVTTVGTMTYWISTIDGVLPAEGPALRCEQEQAATAELPVTPTVPPPPPTPTPTTGTLVVATYTCDDVPADTSGFDWFGQCVPGADPLVFQVIPSDGDTTDSWTRETDDRGEAVFDALEPGTYQLDAIDASWCHAKSDRITPESEVVIEAGERTTVWIFLCPEPKTGS